jgi:hypothetical protein
MFLRNARRRVVDWFNPSTAHHVLAAKTSILDRGQDVSETVVTSKTTLVVPDGHRWACGTTAARPADGQPCSQALCGPPTAAGSLGPVDGMTLVATIVVPSVSVIATATVPVWSKLIDASTKREDRHHEIAVEVERRFGQDKINALKTLIAATQHVKWRAQLTGAANTNEAHRRGVTIRALHKFRAKLGDTDGIAELLAYAADPVRDAVELLLAEVNEQRRRYLVPWLMQLENIEQRRATLPKPEPGHEVGDPVPMTPMPVDIFQQLQSSLRSESQTLDKIGNDSDLDVDGVIALCDKVINTARDDLRGRYGND